MSRATSPAPSRLRATDLFRLGIDGLRTRPLRAALSSAGIAIGIAAMIAVIGISTSSQAHLDAQLDKLGTNMLIVTPGNDTETGLPVPLPATAVQTIARAEGVDLVSGTGEVKGVHAYRNAKVDPAETNGLTVQAADDTLPRTLRATMAAGSWLDEAPTGYPTAVLGHRAAYRLGVTGPGEQIWLGSRHFTVVGVMDPVPLAAELESAVFVSTEMAQRHLGYDGSPTRIYERSDDSRVQEVRTLLPRAVNPVQPQAVQVSRPSDALAAREAAEESFTGLLVGLGSVALLVGGIGVANTMVITVMERRREIGLRRALGATRRHITRQFLVEAVLLSLLGGSAGVALGWAVTAGYAVSQGWPTAVPLAAPAGGLASTVAIGALAGLYPALRAARTPPTVALASV